VHKQSKYLFLIYKYAKLVAMPINHYMIKYETYEILTRVIAHTI